MKMTVTHLNAERSTIFPIRWKVLFPDFLREKLMTSTTSSVSSDDERRSTNLNNRTGRKAVRIAFSYFIHGKALRLKYLRHAAEDVSTHCCGCCSSRTFGSVRSD